MLFKFIILTFFSISVSLGSIIANAFEEGMVKSSLPEPNPSDEDWLRALDRHKWVSNPEGDNLVSIFRSSFLVITHRDCLMKTRELTLDERSNICDNWIRNRGQVVLLDQDMRELLDFISMLRTESSQSKSSVDDNLSLSKIQKMTEDYQSLNIIKNKLTILKEIKFLGLTGLDQQELDLRLLAGLGSENYKAHAGSALAEEPDDHIAGFLEKGNDLVGLIADKAWLSFVNSIIGVLKRSIQSHNLFLHRSEENHLTITAEGEMWWKFTLKTIDFLFKNNLIDENTVRQFFQSPDFCKAIACYAQSRFSEINYDWIAPLSHVTEHWYWHRLHECFKALSQQEKVMINAAVLLIVRRYEMLKFNRAKPSAHSATYESLLGTFQNSRPLKFLTLMCDSHSSHNLQWTMSEVKTWAQDQALKMMNFLGNDAVDGPNEATLGDMVLKSTLLIFVYYLLEFIEDNISPGITNTAKPEIVNFQYFTYRFHELKFQSKCYGLDWRQDMLDELMKKECQDWSSSIHYKSKFHDFLLEARHILNQFQAETSILFPESGHEGRTLEIYGEILNTKQVIEVLVQKLETKYTTFRRDSSRTRS